MKNKIVYIVLMVIFFIDSKKILAEEENGVKSNIIINNIIQNIENYNQEEITQDDNEGAPQYDIEEDNKDDNEGAPQYDIEEDNKDDNEGAPQYDIEEDNKDDNEGAPQYDIEEDNKDDNEGAPQYDIEEDNKDDNEGAPQYDIEEDNKDDNEGAPQYDIEEDNKDDNEGAPQYDIEEDNKDDNEGAPQYDIEEDNKDIDITINEIAWMGTKADSNDEWIELFNNTNKDINLDGFILQSQDGVPNIQLNGIIKSKDFYLLERTDDDVLSVNADQIYTGAMSNKGEVLTLYDSYGSILDTANRFTAGDNDKKYPMQRCGNRWVTCDIENIDVLDIAGNNIYGTPGESNICDDRKTIDQNSVSAKEIKEKKEETKYSNNIFINEVVMNPAKGEKEYIELINIGNKRFNLKGWSIDDVLGGGGKPYIIKKDLFIEPQGFAVIETKFLNNNGDEVNLFDSASNLIDKISYIKTKKGMSYGRDQTFNFGWTKIETPGMINDYTIQPVKDIEFPLNIFSVLPNPKGKDKDNEYLTFYNPNKYKVNIKGWSISNKKGIKYLIKDEIILNPKATYEIKLKGMNLVNKRDQIKICDKKGVLVDLLSWKNAKEDELVKHFVPGSETKVRVKRVIDGDTIEVMLDGIKRSIRLIGIDTPETKHPDREIESYGKEAYEYLNGLLLGEEIILKYGQQKEDKYNRILGYIHLDNLFVNADIVRKGYGRVYTRYDFDYLDLFTEYENEAKNLRRGIWGKFSRGENEDTKEIEETQKIEKTEEEKEYIIDIAPTSGEYVLNTKIKINSGYDVFYYESDSTVCPTDITKYIKYKEDIILDKAFVLCFYSGDELEIKKEIYKIKDFSDELIINEVYPVPVNDEEEFIELFNKSDKAIDLNGFKIQDKKKSYTIEKGIYISSKGYYVLEKPKTKISLNNDKDEVKLVDPNGYIKSFVTYQNLKKGQSISYIKNKYIITDKVTKNTKNEYIVDIKKKYTPKAKIYYYKTIKIKGKTIPNGQIKIKLHSDPLLEITGIADSNGKFSIPIDIKPGVYDTEIIFYFIEGQIKEDLGLMEIKESTKKKQNNKSVIKKKNNYFNIYANLDFLTGKILKLNDKNFILDTGVTKYTVYYDDNIFLEEEDIVTVYGIKEKGVFYMDSIEIKEGIRRLKSVTKKRDTEFIEIIVMIFGLIIILVCLKRKLKEI